MDSEDEHDENNKVYICMTSIRRALLLMQENEASSKHKSKAKKENDVSSKDKSKAKEKCKKGKKDSG